MIMIGYWGRINFGFGFSLLWESGYFYLLKFEVLYFISVSNFELDVKGRRDFIVFVNNLFRRRKSVKKKILFCEDNEFLRGYE